MALSRENAHLGREAMAGIRDGPHVATVAPPLGTHDLSVTMPARSLVQMLAEEIDRHLVRIARFRYRAVDVAVAHPFADDQG
jgi:hypothetical protein